MNWFYIKLPYFTMSQRIELVASFSSSVFNTLSNTEQNNLKILFSRINADTSEDTLSDIMLFVQDIMYRLVPVAVYAVNQGEDLNITITKNSTDNYTGYALVARAQADQTLLSDPEHMGNNNAEQTIALLDVPLSTGIHRININIEEVSAGETTGDVVSMLLYAFLVIDREVDADA